MSTVNIAGLPKAEVLRALVNASTPMGLSVFRALAHPEGLTIAEAEDLIERATAFGLYFDYVAGRVVKCDLSKDDMEARLYDRDNGDGAAERVIAELRARCADAR